MQDVNAISIILSVCDKISVKTNNFKEINLS